MTQALLDSFLISKDTAGVLAVEKIGGLIPVKPQPDLTQRYEVLDSFDQALRGSDRLLIELGSSVDLLSTDGSILSQPSKRTGRFVADLQDGPVKRALADMSPLRSLDPVGSGRLTRTALDWIDDDQKTRCRGDLQIFSQDTGQGLAIITLRGLRGYDRAIAALRHDIVALGGVSLDMGAFYDRLFPDLVAYNPKPEINLNPGRTALDAAVDIIAAYIPVARANEAGIIADQDTEFLHDYRIALRKIRSVLSLFKGVFAEDLTADLKERFASLMEPTGRLRDLDVYLLEKQQYYDLLPPRLHRGLDAKLALLAAERGSAQKKLARHLLGKRYGREIAALAHHFENWSEPRPGPNAALFADAFAKTLIWKRYRTICRIAAGIGPHTSDDAVHALRIHCKKLRYLMEFFAPVFARPEFKSLLKPLKVLQDNLGLINDYAVQQVNLQQFLQGAGKWPKGEDLEVAQSIGALIAALHRRQTIERAKVVESFAAFNGPSTQATFRDLFRGEREKP